MTTVGLVVEGTNDYPILESLIEHALPACFPRPISIKHLQPVADATSGVYGGGGWGRVVGWCLDNKSDNIETHFSPIEDGDIPCDLIVIQLDGDAMEPCAEHASTACPPPPCTIEDRLATLESFVLEWLDPEATRSGQICVAFPTMHSEAWLMAALSPNSKHWEVEVDAKSPFRALRAGLTPKPSIRDFYRIKSLEAAGHTDTILSQSVSFSKFHSKVTQLAR